MGWSYNSQQAGWGQPRGAAVWGRRGVILTSTGISSSDIELAGLSLAGGVAAAVRGPELGLGGRSLTGTDTGMTIGVRLSASGEGAEVAAGRQWRLGLRRSARGLLSSSYTDNKA